MNQTTRRPINLVVGGKPLDGVVTVPPDPLGLVVCVSGGQGTQHATLETELSSRLHDHNIATLVMELVSLEDSSNRAVRTDMETLTRRLDEQLAWVRNQDDLESLDVALCGLGTGAAATLEYLATQSVDISGATLLDGRVGLASVVPSTLRTPLLFSVAEPSEQLETENRDAYERINATDSAAHFLQAPDPDRFDIIARWFESILRPAKQAVNSQPAADEYEA
jgi:pimeloyl-ACP methyl ester carboxylesterase